MLRATLFSVIILFSVILLSLVRKSHHPLFSSPSTADVHAGQPSCVIERYHRLALCLITADFTFQSQLHVARPTGHHRLSITLILDDLDVVESVVHKQFTVRSSHHYCERRQIVPRLWSFNVTEELQHAGLLFGGCEWQRGDKVHALVVVEVVLAAEVIEERRG